jgi:hypothetical protein
MPAVAPIVVESIKTFIFLVKMPKKQNLSVKVKEGIDFISTNAQEKTVFT